MRELKERIGLLHFHEGRILGIDIPIIRSFDLTEDFRLKVFHLTVDYSQMFGGIHFSLTFDYGGETEIRIRTVLDCLRDLTNDYLEECYRDVTMVAQRGGIPEPAGHLAPLLLKLAPTPDKAVLINHAKIRRHRGPEDTFDLFLRLHNLTPTDLR
jgi:hypothetical protein